MEKITLSVVIGGLIASSFNSSINSSTKSITQLGSEIKNMNREKINIKRFKELQKNTQGNRKEFVRLGRSLKESGYDLKNFSNDTSRLNKNLLKLKKNLLIKAKIQVEKNKFSQQKDGLLATAGTALAIGGVLNLRSEVLQAQGELKSLKIGDIGIAKITKEAKNFSNTFAGTTTPEFIKAAYDIKSGISSLGDTAVAKFTRLAAITAGATKSTTTQMTSFFATGYGIYSKQFDALSSKTIEGWDKLSQEEKDIKFGETFSAGIGSAVQLFKTDGAKMQSAIETLGAAATTSNVPFAEQLAILGQLQKSFPSGSEAATAYKGFLRGAAGAQEKLNLQFLDGNNQLKSAPQILEELRSKYGDTLDDMEKQDISSAFGGEEGMKFITQFYDNVDELKTNINGMNDSLANGTETVNKMNEATQNGKGFILLGQQLMNLGATIGKVFYPAASLLGNVLGAVAIGLDTLITNFPITSSVIGYAVVGIFSLVAIVKTAILVSSAYKFSMLALRKSFLGNIRMFKAMRLHLARFNVMSTLATAKQWLFNIALNANPIGLIITGVAALIGLGVLLYKNFEPFKNLIDSIVSGIGSVVSSVGSFLFGDSKKDEKAVNTKNYKIGSTIRKGVVATATTAASAQLVAAQPSLNYVKAPDNKKYSQSHSRQEIKVDKLQIINPKETVDVSKGIKDGFKNNGTPLHDKEI